MEVIQDTWILGIPLFHWPTFISIEVGDHMRVSDLIIANGSSWSKEEITRLFGGPLDERILAILFSVHFSQDVRV